MQEWHLIMNDGYELVITCKKAVRTRNNYDMITDISWKGIKDNVPVKLDLNECKCIYYKILEAGE